MTLLKQKINATHLIVTLFASLLLTSCAGVHTSEGNSKHPRYEVDCSGKLISMDVCYKKAASLCPRGYKVLDHNIKGHNPFPLNTAIGIAVYLANATPGVVKGINIECK